MVATAASTAVAEDACGDTGGSGSAGVAMAAQCAQVASSPLPRSHLLSPLRAVCMTLMVITMFVWLLARSGLQNAGPGRGPAIESDSGDALSTGTEPLSLHRVTSGPLEATHAAAHAHTAPNAPTAADGVVGEANSCTGPPHVAEDGQIPSIGPTTASVTSEAVVSTLQADRPAVTAADRARARAAELSMNEAVQQQMRRAMQVAAERLAAEEVQRQAPLLPHLSEEPAQRRAAL